MDKITNNIIIIAFLFLFIPTCLFATRENPEYRRCISNLRVIDGAKEMMEMDLSNHDLLYFIRKAQESDTETLIEAIAEKKYIKKNSCQDSIKRGCQYNAFINKDQEFTIYCEKHGCFENLENYFNAGYGYFSVSRRGGNSRIESLMLLSILAAISNIIPGLICLIKYLTSNYKLTI